MPCACGGSYARRRGARHPCSAKRGSLRHRGCLPRKREILTALKKACSRKALALSSISPLRNCNSCASTPSSAPTSRTPFLPPKGCASGPSSGPMTVSQCCQSRARRARPSHAPSPCSTLASTSPTQTGCSSFSRFRAGRAMLSPLSAARACGQGLDGAHPAERDLPSGLTICAYADTYIKVS